MSFTGEGPVYKLKDERYFLVLVKQKADSRCIDIYFINSSTEEIQSLRARTVEYCYKTNIKESEQQTFVEEIFYSIPPGGYVVFTALNIINDNPGEYISSFEIITGSEKVIAECTLYKESILSASFDKAIPILGKEGKKIHLESRTFSK